MNELKWLTKKEIAILTDWEVIQIVEKRARNSGSYTPEIEFLCLLRRVK